VRILAELFHIAEGIEVTCARLVKGIKTRGYLPDVLHANGLIEDASPTHVKGTSYHLVVGANGGRSEEEGILAMQAAEVDSEGRRRRLLG
jgi:hypothetical protein